MRFLLPLSAFLLSLVAPSAALAEEAAPPLLLWGFQRGCEALPDLDRQVLRELEKEGLGPVHYLAPEAASRSCQGAACAEFVRASCGSAQDKPVRILGGQVDSSKDLSLSRLRLWLHNTGTGQTAWYDTYCQGCPLSSLASGNAVKWVQNPTFGPDPGPAPGSYCAPSAAPSERPPSSNTIFWVVFGKDANKPAVSGAVKRAARETGTEVVLEHGGKPYSLGTLKKIVSKDRGAQVLGAEVLGPGEVELFLFDGPTELTENAKVDCKACDKDAVAEQVHQAAQQLLRHCFGADCAKGGGLAVKPPSQACEPWPEPQRCGGSFSVRRSEGGGIDPKLAALVKGSVWGLFAASAVGAGILFGLSGTDVGTIEQNGARALYTLDRPAWALTGVAIATLGIAIPLTIAVNRSTKSDQQTKPSDVASHGEAAKTQALRCP